MVAVNVPINAVTKAGSAPPAPVTGDPANGNVIKGITNDTLVVIQNTHATVAQTATLRAHVSVDGQVVPDRVITIAAVSSQEFSHLSTSLYGTDLTITPSTTDIKLTAKRAQ
jgi:methenyltetrahydromethanopterin cyclohydrolase